MKEATFYRPLYSRAHRRRGLASLYGSLVLRVATWKVAMIGMSGYAQVVSFFRAITTSVIAAGPTILQFTGANRDAMRQGSRRTVSSGSRPVHCELGHGSA
jgi:hypothetical protein